VGGVLIFVAVTNNEPPFGLSSLRAPAGVGGEIAPERSGNCNVSPASVWDLLWPTMVDGGAECGAVARLGDFSADFNGQSLDDVEACGLRLDPSFGCACASREPSRVGRCAGDPVLLSSELAGGLKLEALGEGIPSVCDDDCVG